MQAACAYALISLIDPSMYVSSGLLRGFTMTAREGSVLNPHFPAPVNTYNPTIHALVDAIFEAMSRIVPDKVRADGSGSRSIILGGRNTYTGKGYVQYEIIAGGAGARPGKDGVSGITVNQSNAKIAPVEIIESEFPTRITRFELIQDSGGAGEFRGGLGIRREYLNLADARFSIRSMKHLIPPAGCAGGYAGRPGDIWINPDGPQAKRLPTRYADYPLRAATSFGSIRPVAAVTAIRSRAIPNACSWTCAKGMFRQKQPSASTASCSSKQVVVGRRPPGDTCAAGANTSDQTRAMKAAKASAGSIARLSSPGVKFINRQRKTMKTQLLGLAIGVVLAAATASAQGSSIKVRVGYDGFSMTSGPLIYADKQGVFKKFGLDITPIFVDGGSMLTQAVVGGSVDIAQNGYTPALSAAVQGADIVIIGGISNKLPFQLVVKTSITNAEQLKGQSVAISRYGSSTDAAADFALAHLKLTRNDVKILQLGGAATRMAAAMSGQIAGTMEQYPDTAELARHGYHVLVDVTDIAGDYPNTSFVTSRGFLKKSTRRW